MKTVLRVLAILLVCFSCIGLFAACSEKTDADGFQSSPVAETASVTTENFQAETESFAVPADGVGLVISADPGLITWREYSTNTDIIDFAKLDLQTLGALSADMSLCYLYEDITFFLIENGERKEAAAGDVVPGSVIGVSTLEEGVQEVYILYEPNEDEVYFDDVIRDPLDDIPQATAPDADADRKPADEPPKATDSAVEEDEEGPSFTVLTQNILFKNIEGGNTVAERQPRFKCLVDEYAPDILCIQECSAEWKNYIINTFGSIYTLAYADSNTGTTENLIFFRTARYEILDSGVIWLSNTPYALSKFDDASGPRTCNWAFVEDRFTGKCMFVANAHLDWNHDRARKKQLNVLLQEFDTYFNSYNAVLCGDFNSTPDGPIYAGVMGVLNDSMVTAMEDSSEVDYTYHNFGKSKQLIDYIFHTDSLNPFSYRILNDTYGGDVSDHYGIVVEFSFVY